MPGETRLIAARQLPVEARALSVMNTIRPLTASDVPGVADWIAAIPLWQRYHYTAARAAEGLYEALTRGDLLLTADCDGETACGLVWCMPRGAFGRSTYLRLLGVRADFHGAGLGAALLDAAEQAAAHTRDMILLVSDFNHGAQRFYERQGYRQVGALPGYVLPDVTELIYRKRLSTSGESSG
jgi:ribosomal protein S18 acetylase RimI-like enzyme